MSKKESLKIFHRNSVIVQEERFIPLSKILIDFYTLPKDSTDQEKADVFASTGSFYGRIKDEEKEVYWLNKTLEINPNHAYALFLKASCIEEKDFRQAMDLYYKVLEIDKRYFFAPSIQFRFIEKHCNESEQLKHYRKLLTYFPFSTGLLGNKAEILKKLGQNKEVLSIYDKIEEINPENEYNLVDKAELLGVLGQFDEGKKSYDKAIKVSFGRETIGNSEMGLIGGKAKFLLKYVSLKEAISYLMNYFEIKLEMDMQDISEIKCENIVSSIMYRSAYEGSNINLKKLSAKAEVLRELKQNTEAMSCYDELLQVEPNNLRLLTHKASTLSELKRFEDAMTIYDSVLKSSQTHYEALMGKAEVLEKQNEWNSALAIYENMLKNQRKRDSKVILRKAFVLTKLGYFDDVVNLCNEVLEKEPNDTVALLYASYALYKNKEFKNAIVFLDKHLKQIPTDETIILLKGECHYNLKEYKKAIECYEQAIKIKPDFIEAWYNKASSFSQMGEIQDSLNCLEKVISIDPKLKDTIKNGNEFEILRNNQRFNQLLKE